MIDATAGPFLLCMPSFDRLWHKEGVEIDVERHRDADKFAKIGISVSIFDVPKRIEGNAYPARELFLRRG